MVSTSSRLLHSPQRLPLEQEFDEKGRENQEEAKHRRRNEAFVVFRRINLLPHYQRQPCLQHIGHLVHACYDDGALLVVIAANLMCPSGYSGFSRIHHGFEVRGVLAYAMQMPDMPPPKPIR